MNLVEERKLKPNFPLVLPTPYLQPYIHQSSLISINHKTNNYIGILQLVCELFKFYFMNTSIS